ncbi:MAG: class I SAM-dependent methyltransferase [Armatimonadota bacterium]|nr:class I SAM-dependent methyltransferase [Armatimonadota bacterium]
MSDPREMNPAEVKSCCANVYEHPLVQQLIGDSFHPGGTKLTERLGTMLGLSSESLVLDVASGCGTSAIHLAKTFGCRVTGVDLSSRNVAVASTEAKELGVSELTLFVQGDAEKLPFEPAQFDAVICECALCTFPDKPLALSEFYRVLRTPGLVGIADLTRTGALTTELDGLLSWVACIADALPAVEYLQLLSEAGFWVESGYTAADESLADMASTVQKNLVGAKILKGLGKLELPPSVNLDEAVRVAKAAREAIDARQLGYGIFIGTKAALA